MIFCFAAKRKKLYQEPSKVIFKINDKGLLSMQHPDSNQSNEIKFKDEADNIKEHGQTVETTNLKSFEEEKLKRTQSSEVTSTKALKKSSESTVKIIRNNLPRFQLMTEDPILKLCLCICV